MGVDSAYVSALTMRAFAVVAAVVAMVALAAACTVKDGTLDCHGEHLSEVPTTIPVDTVSLYV